MAHELLRIAKERTIDDPKESISWRRVSRVYLDSGEVLARTEVVFKPTLGRKAGEPYTYPWKLVGKAGHTPQELVESIKVRLSASESKWAVVAGEPPAVIIKLEDVVKAVEEDDNLGFCIGCGEEASGCEPDARNYPCDACGQSLVYGAEELLMVLA